MRRHWQLFGLRVGVVSIAGIFFVACTLPLYISDNKKLESPPPVQGQFDPGQIAVFLALSGGGTRAAALAYGAMTGLARISHKWVKPRG